MISKENRGNAAICFGLILGTLLLYWPVRRFDLVDFDDPVYLYNNFHIRTFNWDSFLWCFQAKYASLWHPVTWLSFMLDWQCYRMWPGGYHFTNLLLHAANSTLLFLILRRMTQTFWRSAMVAALFAWHPLHVESVAWISERKDVLSSLFWMLTILAYVQFVQEFKAFNSMGSPGKGTKYKFYYLLSLFFFALGLMAKPMLVTLPFILLLLDWWPLDRFTLIVGREKSSTWKPLPRLILEKVPFLLLAAGASVLTLRAAAGNIISLGSLSFPWRIANALVTYFHYVKQMIWPQGLVVIYPFEQHWSAWAIAGAAVFLIAVSVVAFRARKVRPYWLVFWLFYLGILVPVIGVVQVGAQPSADRYTYLSSIGIFIIICWEAVELTRGWRRGPAILAAAGGLSLAACLVLSGQQIQTWRNSLTLLDHNVRVTPNNSFAHATYAVSLRDAGQLARARAEAEEASRIFADSPFAHEILGDVLFDQGNLDQAAAELQKSLELSPGRVGVNMTLGRILLARNAPAEALAQFSIVLADDAANPEAHCHVGEALAMQGKLDEACSEYLEALKMVSQYPEAHFQLAVARARQHKSAEAVAEYRAVLALQPNRVDALNNLAWTLATDPHSDVRNGAEAVKLATQACKLTGEQAPTFIGTLAAAYAEAGQFNDAIASAQKAHDLAEAQGKKSVADRNLELLATYRSHQAFHENP